MKYFKVTCEETCQACSGSGVITNLLYRKMWKDFDVFKKASLVDTYLSDEWQEEWAVKNGYGSADAMGSQEEQCSDCNGEGRISKEVALDEALKELGYINGDELFVGPNFSLGQRVKLSKSDGHHLNGEIQALPGFKECRSIDPVPYYSVLFDCVDGSQESLWLTANEIVPK